MYMAHYSMRYYKVVDTEDFAVLASERAAVVADTSEDFDVLASDRAAAC